MNRANRWAIPAAGLAALTAAALAAVPALAAPGAGGQSQQNGQDKTIKHVLLLSVEGMHQSYLNNRSSRAVR
jgi:hypothetical protein